MSSESGSSGEIENIAESRIRDSQSSSASGSEYIDDRRITSRRSTRHQLPKAVEGFVGRHAEIANIRKYLLNRSERAEGAPVALITGLGGVGKTALAIHTAHLLEASFPDGQLFIQLAGATGAPLSPADAIELVLRALGIASESIPEGLASRQALYRSLLLRARLLLVLDNAGDVGQVRPILPIGSKSAVIITSRDNLDGIDAERFALDTLSESEALELLIRLIGEALVNAEPAAATDVVRYCGYLPLAIRIAGGRLNASYSGARLSLGSLAEELADESRRLDALGDKRERPLRTALQMSVESLQPDAARLFRLLGAAHLPDIDADIAAVLLDSDLDAARSLLREIVSRGLINVYDGTEPRYRMHDLTRLYAGELAEKSYDQSVDLSAVERVLVWFSNKLDAAASWLSPGRARPDAWPDSLEEAITWLENQRRNVVAAVESAATHGLPELAAEMSVAVARFLERRSYWDDAERIHLVGLRSARSADRRDLEQIALVNLGTVFRQEGRLEEAIDMLRQAIDVAQASSDHSAELTALFSLARAYQRRGQLDEATDALRRAVAIAQTSGDNLAESWALIDLANAFQRRGMMNDAVESLRAAIEVARGAGELSAESEALVNLGTILVQQGNSEEAIYTFRQGLEIAHAVGDRYIESAALAQMGDALAAAGRLGEAIAAYRQSLDISRERGDRDGESATLTQLGNALSDLRMFDAAIDAYEQGIAIARELGSRADEARILGNLGNVRLQMGLIDGAVASYGKSLEVARELGDRYGEAVALGNIGFAYSQSRRFEEALNASRNALAIFEEIGHTHGVSVMQRNIGSALSSLKRFPEALEAYERSLQSVRLLGDQLGEADLRANLGNTFGDMGDFSQALEMYSASLGIVRKVGDRFREGRLLANLGNVYSSRGELEAAVDAYERSLAIKRERDDHGQISTLTNLGIAYAKLGRKRDALRLYQEALEIAWRLGDRYSEGNILSNLGSLHLEQQEAKRAVDYYTQSLAAFKELGDEYSQIPVLANLGMTLRAQGDSATADLYLAQARELAQKHGRNLEDLVENLGVRGTSSNG